LKNSVHAGSAIALLVPIFMIFASAGISASVYRRIDSISLKTTQERTQITAIQNLREIVRIQKLSDLSEKGWEKNTSWNPTRSEPERIAKELFRQFPDQRSRNRCEDIFYITLLNNAFPEQKDFLEPKATEAIKANVDTAAKRLAQGWGAWENSKRVFILIEKFERPDTGRWIFVPSIRQLSQVIKRSPVAAKIFQIFMFGGFYTGIGAESERETWEKLRWIEMSNVGTDSLGMYPGNSIF
jgi:hypothetical protein